MKWQECSVLSVKFYCNISIGEHLMNPVTYGSDLGNGQVQIRENHKDKYDKPSVPVRISPSIGSSSFAFWTAATSELP